MPTQYRIWIKGHLEPGWSDRLSDMGIRHLPDGETLLEGRLSDQAALNSVLNKLYALGLVLIRVEMNGT